MSKNSYKLLQTDHKNFFKSIDRMCSNTVSFENCSHLEKYSNKNINSMKDSKKELIYIDNVIINKYLHKLREKAELKSLTKKEKKDYNMNPYLCSLETMGYPDFWWVILAINNYSTVFEFTNLNRLLIPNREQISELLTYELARDYNSNLGKVVN